MTFGEGKACLIILDSVDMSEVVLWFASTGTTELTDLVSDGCEALLDILGTEEGLGQ